MNRMLKFTSGNHGAFMVTVLDVDRNITLDVAEADDPLTLAQWVESNYPPGQGLDPDDFTDTSFSNMTPGKIGTLTAALEDASMYPSGDSQG